MSVLIKAICQGRGEGSGEEGGFGIRVGHIKLFVFEGIWVDIWENGSLLF